MAYLKGIYYALCGRVEIESYDCRPIEAPIDMDDFADIVSRDYAAALELLAE